MLFHFNILLNFKKNFKLNKYNNIITTTYHFNQNQIFKNEKIILTRHYSIYSCLKSFINLFVKYELDQKATRKVVSLNNRSRYMFTNHNRSFNNNLIEAAEKVNNYYLENEEFINLAFLIREEVLKNNFFIYHIVTTPLFNKIICLTILSTISVILYICFSGTTDNGRPPVPDYFNTPVNSDSSDYGPEFDFPTEALEIFKTT